MVCALGVHHFSRNRNFYCVDRTVMSKKDLMIVLFLFTVPFALLGLYGTLTIGFLYLANDDSITLTKGKNILSPNGNKKAVLYVASGGGAAGWVHHSVAILNASDTLDESVFKSVKTVFSKRCCDSIAINWENDTTLQIRYIKEDEYCVYKIQESSGDVNIKYIADSLRQANPALVENKKTPWKMN